MKTARKIFLTGASAGIGLATAQALAAAGCEVWGTARQRDRLPGGLPGFHPVELALNDARSLRGGFAGAEKEAGGRFDVLINNAGGGWFGPGAEIPEAELREQFQTLALGPLTLIQLALPGMRRRGWGRVVNMSSIYGLIGATGRIGYVTSKTALLGLTRLGGARG